MATSPAQSDRKQPRAASRESSSSSSPSSSLSSLSSSSSSSPESSLTWCLANLSKPAAGADQPSKALSGPKGGKEIDKKSRSCQWKALVAVRTLHIKADTGITRFRTQGGLLPLLGLLKDPECSRKTLDLGLSILANCCTEPETRVEVRKLDGIDIIVGILKSNVAVETIQNRAARALGNLAMDADSCALIHSSGGVPPLLLCLALPSAPSSPTAASSKEPCPKHECAQSAARALGYLSDSPCNRLSLLTQGTLSALAPLIAPEYPKALRRAALRTLFELTRGCGIECARDVSRSGVLSLLGVMASGEDGKPFEELALKTLANMCSQGSLRPLVGSLGVIQKFIQEVKKDPLKSGLFLKALCLCCKEAVNRAVVKENGGLEVLTGVLSTHQNHPLSWLTILACVDFVFDESAMEQLQELGLVSLLVARLVRLTKGDEQCAQEVDAGTLSNMSPTELLSLPDLDSFDFPAPESYKKEEAGSSSFQSLRSWLVTEGLISSEGDLLDSSGAEGEWAGLQISPSSSSLQTSPPSRFSSPHKRRQRSQSATSATKVTADSAPPSALRPTPYYHPYHPEPWTTESPILLLLSCFSHGTDPSAALISSSIMSGLLYYLSQHQDPSSRCFRMLCRLSCNPNCLQALVRTGSVALIHHRLCQRQKGSEGDERQTDLVKAKVKQLGVTLLSNLHVQCETGFGSGVLAHVMMSGSESDKMNCALSLPLLCSNKSLLKKLLLDNGGLLMVLQPLCDSDDTDKDNPAEGPSLSSSLFASPHPGQNSQLHPLYISLLVECLCALMRNMKTDVDKSLVNSSLLLKYNKIARASPPPSKKPRLSDKCSYEVSNFDVLLQLDDGTEVPANMKAVAGEEGADQVGSEYLRALLRGGFKEAERQAGEAICIKDVSTGMLIPVLHYLHGCRFTSESTSEQDEGGEKGGQCRVLESLVLDGLKFRSQSPGDFQETPLGEMMIGARRFLVTGLGRDLEELCVYLLLSRATKADAAVAEPTPAEGSAEKPAGKKNQQCHKSAEENLAQQTSELQLAGLETQKEHARRPVKRTNSSAQQVLHKNISGALRRRGGSNTVKSVSSCSQSNCLDKRLNSEESKLKNPRDSSVESMKSATQGVGRVAGSGALSSLLYQLYWFSQCYSYPALGRFCLSLLLGCQDCPLPFSSSSSSSSSSLAADCLRRLTRDADCRGTLKKDLLSFATEALS